MLQHFTATMSIACLVLTRWHNRYAELFASVDRVFCEGPYMASSNVRLGCPEHKVQVHHLGVAVDQIAYQPRSRSAGEPLRILIAGTFREKKGIPDALRAVGELNLPSKWRRPSSVKQLMALV